MRNLKFAKIKQWFYTNPEIFNNGPVIRKRDVFDSYAAWAKRRKVLPADRIALGMALNKLIPGIEGKQVMRRHERYMVYVLPKNFSMENDDFDL